jgi:DNA invertase Pin-like site-specific DNA recombinase
MSAPHSVKAAGVMPFEQERPSSSQVFLCSDRGRETTGRLMLAVLGGLADVERDLIRTRTAEGRVRAKTREVHMGRPSKLTPEQRREAIARR